MRALLVLTAVCLLAGPTAQASPATFVDAVLAEAGNAVVTASDIALARGLHLFGFRPSAAPIQPEDLERYEDALLVDQEAARLQIVPAKGEVDEAWEAAAVRVGGAEALTVWLDGQGIGLAWGRRMVEADLRWRRFVALRFRAFAFVSEADVNAALGPGAPTPEERERVRESLLAAATEQSLAAWLRDARGRAHIRRTAFGSGGTPAPFPMPSGTPPTGGASRHGAAGQ